MLSLIHIYSANNKILFTPIPLDISVDIPGIGSKKLSDTYSWGDNTDLLLEAIKSKFDTNITREMCIRDSIYAAPANTQWITYNTGATNKNVNSSGSVIPVSYTHLE